MSEQEKYIPLNERDPYGSAVEDRDIRAKIAQSNWKPVMVPPKHPLDPQVDEWEQRAANENRKDHLKPLAQRMAGYFRDMRDKDIDAKESEAERQKHSASVADRVAKLKELREIYSEIEDGHTYSQIDRIDNAIAQYETMGARRDVADKMFDEVMADRESQLDLRETERQARITALQSELAELRQSRGKSIAPPPNVVKPTFVEFWASLDEGRGGAYTPHSIAKQKYQAKYGDDDAE